MLIESARFYRSVSKKKKKKNRNEGQDEMTDNLSSYLDCTPPDDD